MTLDDLLTLLGEADQALVLPHAFTTPHSYRGVYDELAFEPAENVTVGEVAAAAWSAMDETYTGHKGGEYTMTGDTPCWMAYEGSAGGEEITPELMAGFLAAGTAASAEAEPPLANGEAAHARQLATLLRQMIGNPNSQTFDHETAPGLARAADRLDTYADQADAATAGKPFLLDAYGRTIRAGDTVGGTTSGRYQATISGPILQLGAGRVKVRVTSPGGDGAYRPAQGAEKWISTDRVFLIARA